MFRLTLIGLCLGLVACASTPPPGEPMAGATQCEEPRPQVCTADYRPVCATLADGSQKTYSNGCSACGDPAVGAWVEGECAE